MKVRIIKADKVNWYKDSVGEVFEVYITDSGNYSLCKDRFYGINKEDAEVVEDVDKSCESCKFNKADLCANPITCDINASGWQPIENKSCQTCKYCVDDECLAKDCNNFSGWVSKPTQATGTTEEAKHYQVAEVQPIEIMQATMSKEQLEGYLLGNVIKYALRLNHKGQKVSDAGKCNQYAEWLQVAINGGKIVPGGKV